MTALLDLAREALEELRDSQFVVDPRPLDNGCLDDVDVCTSCGHDCLGPNGKRAHLCARTRLIADLEAAIREARR